MAVEDGPCRFGDRILLVVAFREHRVERGDGTAAARAVARAFHQLRQRRANTGRIATRVTGGSPMASATSLAMA